ncbi:MAG: hypothetical protein AAGJ96_09195, partial [Pseudomonadota bacterium]
APTMAGHPARSHSSNLMMCLTALGAPREIYGDYMEELAGARGSLFPNPASPSRSCISVTRR